MPFSLKWTQGHPKERELVAFVDGELRPARRKAIFAHLTSCDGCSQELRLIQQAENLIREAGAGSEGGTREAAKRLQSLIAAHRSSLGQSVREQVGNLLGAKLAETAERAACTSSSAAHGLSAVDRELQTFLGRRAAGELKSRLAADEPDQDKASEPVE
ncbi:MAG: anti-sigma factor family protein [Bryobacteraceae bacterium]